MKKAVTLALVFTLCMALCALPASASSSSLKKPEVVSDVTIEVPDSGGTQFTFTNIYNQYARQHSLDEGYFLIYTSAAEMTCNKTLYLYEFEGVDEGKTYSYYRYYTFVTDKGILLQTYPAELPMSCASLLAAIPHDDEYAPFRIVVPRDTYTEGRILYLYPPEQMEFALVEYSFSLSRGYLSDFIVEKMTATKGVTVEIAGKAVSFDVPPQIINGRVMVPLRAIFDLLGATTDYDPATQIVTAVKEDRVVILTIGDTNPTVDGKVVPIDQPAIIIDSRTLAPLRFVAEAFDGTVNWDAASQKAVIYPFGSGN